MIEMTKPTVMQAALIAALETFSERIEKAIMREETWEYCVDSIEIDGVVAEQTLMRMAFDRSDLSGYWLKINVGYHDGDGETFDNFVLHVSVTPKKIITVIESPTKPGEQPTFHDPIDDLGSIVYALAEFEDKPELFDQMVSLTREQQEREREYNERRSRFKLIVNPTKDE